MSGYNHYTNPDPPAPIQPGYHASNPSAPYHPAPYAGSPLPPGAPPVGHPAPGYAHGLPVASGNTHWGGHSFPNPASFHPATHAPRAPIVPQPGGSMTGTRGGNRGSRDPFEMTPSVIANKSSSLNASAGNSPGARQPPTAEDLVPALCSSNPKNQKRPPCQTFAEALKRANEDIGWSGPIQNMRQLVEDPDFKLWNKKMGCNWDWSKSVCAHYGQQPAQQNVDCLMHPPGSYRNNYSWSVMYKH
ncbi:hypothetical protein P389DRAFT_195560 [Cystobasidium minutum MCA 4210]|uniref:uncharacterized protein n=1 Tax=Cystobasidium minutum MCA 4210 TaxID=1397322 RepID=UPI0034CEB0BD|eukprot:jgi/Rhomi1/195560/gm1.3774_g